MADLTWTSQIALPAAHTSERRKIREAVLTGATTNADVVLARPIGFNRITEMWVKVPITVNTSGNAVVPVIANGSTVRIFGI